MTNVSFATEIFLIPNFFVQLAYICIRNTEPYLELDSILLFTESMNLNSYVVHLAKLL